MNIHNTLAEDIYNKNLDRLEISPLIFPGRNEPSFQEGTDSLFRNEIIKRAEELLESDYPLITLSDYRLFSENGNRVLFEEKYFKRRRMLTSLTLAECVEGNGRFTDKILDGLYLILEETTWCLPAHNTLIRDSKQLEIPDVKNPVIDLFAAESAAVAGVCELLLRDRFNEISSFISEYIDREIEERIITPYLSYHFWWMGNGLEPMCNWTPWITQNILLSVFTRRKGIVSKDIQKKVLAKAVSSIDYFLDEYGEDGCCDEGAQYYGHAGLCLFGCIDILNRITDNVFMSMYDSGLIRNIASYIMKMYVGDGYYINYADCSPFPGKRGVRDYLFAKNTGNKAYASFSAKDYRDSDINDRINPDEENLYYHILGLIYHNEMKDFKDDISGVGDSYFKSTGILIARDEHFTLAVKAGDNGDSHNHNDVGSITLYKDCKPYLIDLGVETYTARTFSPNRYEIWTMQSLYHNTVNFVSQAGKTGKPDICQHEGPEFGACDVRTCSDTKEAYIEFDMAKAYKDIRIRSCHRRIRLVRGEAVCVEDSFDLDEGINAVLTLMFYDEPKILKEEGEGGIYIIKTGEDRLIKASGIKKAQREVCPIKDERLKKAWKHDCFRVLLYVEKDRASLRIS